MKVIDDNVLPDKIEMKKIGEYYEIIEKLLKEDPHCVFFSMHINKLDLDGEKK